MEPTPIAQTVDHLFRRQAGRMVSTLTAILGARYIDLAEDVVQEALLRALQLWPFQGVPQNPQGWLLQVARNLALDRLRRQASLAQKIPEMERRLTPARASDADRGFADDQLAMMFLCCHPELPEHARVCLVLKEVGGFSVAEIARAMLASEDSIAQRLVRAKRQIRDRNLAIAMPPHEEFPSRLDPVLRALYLLFNEGYAATAGESLYRREICDEAIYLAMLLLEREETAQPKVHALLALMLFHAARLDARTDGAGGLLLLEEQDRSKWNRAGMASAFTHLSEAASGEELSSYHVQAALAAAHAAAPSFAETDWAYIATLYDQLLEFEPNPVVALNRAVALAQRDGPAAGLAALAEIADHPSLRNYSLRYAVEARFREQSGDRTRAAELYGRALQCPLNEAEKRFLESKLAALR